MTLEEWLHVSVAWLLSRAPSIKADQDKLAVVIRESWPEQRLVDAVLAMSDPPHSKVLTLAQALGPYNQKDALGILEMYCGMDSNRIQSPD